jgi:hypothetical protein
VLRDFVLRALEFVLRGPFGIPAMSGASYSLHLASYISQREGVNGVQAGAGGLALPLISLPAPGRMAFRSGGLRTSQTDSALPGSGCLPGAPCAPATQVGESHPGWVPSQQQPLPRHLNQQRGWSGWSSVGGEHCVVAL